MNLKHSRLSNKGYWSGRDLLAGCLIASLSLMAPPAFSAECPAQSASELKSRFEVAFRSKDRVAFLSLFYWDGVEPALQDRMTSELTGMLSKELIRAELRDASLSASDAQAMERRGLYLNLVPTASLYFERSVGSDPREKTGGQLAIGRIGNCYLLGMYGKRPLR